MARPKLRLAVLVVAIGALFALVATQLPRSPDALRDALPLEGVPLLVAAIAAWVVLTPLLVPATPSAVATGLLFGTALGTGASLVGATLGGIAAFVLARWLGHGPVGALSGRRLRALQARLARRGFTTVLLARIAPAPATLLHYAAGMSRIRLVHFAPAIARRRHGLLHVAAAGDQDRRARLSGLGARAALSARERGEPHPDTNPPPSRTSPASSTCTRGSPTVAPPCPRSPRPPRAAGPRSSS